MKKWRWFPIGVLVTIAGMGLLALCLITPRHRLDREDILARFRAGMTPAEFEAIGARPVGSNTWLLGSLETRFVSATFNESGRCESVSTCEVQDTSLLAKIRRWLGL